MSASVSALAELYSSSPSTKNYDDFLSQIELKAFHDAEEKFSKDLTAFTKKQFFNVSYFMGPFEFVVITCF